MTSMEQSSSWRTYGLWRWRRHAVPVLVWLCAVGVAGGLLMHRSATCDLSGIANPEQRGVASLVDGRVRLLPVELLQPVQEGQTLVVLDDERVQAAMATATAEVAHLRAELMAAEDRLAVEAATQQAGHIVEARRYAVDVERNRLREIELQVDIETSRGRLEFLRLQRDMLGKLRGQQAVSELRFLEGQAEYESLEKHVSENEKALAQVREDLAEARERAESFAKLNVKPLAVDKALEPLKAAVTVQERRIAELSLERSMMVLKSPMDGVVSQILCRVGETARVGQQILTVVSERPTSVIAYANARQMARLGKGVPVQLEVVREGVVRLSASTQVEAVAPTVEQVPARLWHSPSMPEWGWPVEIAIPPEMGILCGEIVGVRGG